jgi:hypothetical protein
VLVAIMAVLHLVNRQVTFKVSTLAAVATAVLQTGKVLALTIME